jgi:glycine oxidase
MHTRVVVVGGGLIGLAIAWRAAERGLSVTVVDPDPATGASRAAAGMLAPVTELHYGEEALLRLNIAAAGRYPSFVAELEERSGHEVGYRTEGTLAVALDADDRAALADLHAFQRRLGLSVEALTGRECRRLEPMLAPSVRGGLLVESDHSVDNRRLAAALLTAVSRCGVPVVRQPAAGVLVTDDRATGVRLGDGTMLAADVVVLAAGCWTGALGGLPDDVVPPVRPVKGQILRLRVPAALRPFLTHTARGTVRGSPVYLVPRSDGEVVVGATVEEQGFDTRVTAGAVYELLRDAHELVPGISELELAETRAGLRPGSPDNAPLIGPTALPGLVLASGHYRNGVLLAPITADAVTAVLVEGALPELVQPFSPDRFARGLAANSADSVTVRREVSV